MKKYIKERLLLLPLLLSAYVMGSCTGTGTADEILIDDIPDEILIDEPLFTENDETDEILIDDPLLTENGKFPEHSQYETEITEIHDDSRNSGKVLHIVARTEEFQSAFEAIYGTENIPDGVEVKFTVLNTPVYEEDLKSMLFLDLGEPVDIFITEPDYINSYIDSDITLPLSEAGITQADTGMMYPYTIDIGTSSDGVLKAVSLNAWIGVFAYRRDIASEVFGSDDPDYIHDLITNDWEGTAEALAQKGYYIIPSAAEALKPYSQSRSIPWVSDGSITIDPVLKNWANDMRSLREKNYIPAYAQWSDEWCGELTSVGKSFGTFFSTWGTEQILEIYDDTPGKWGVCVPPKPYFWGGSFMCISANTDNTDLCGDILKKMVLDEEAIARYSVENRDFCNNRSAMQKVIENGEAYSDFLAQNSFEVYDAAAENIRTGAEYTSPYDVNIESTFLWEMQNYIDGHCEYDEAEEIFLASSYYMIQ